MYIKIIKAILEENRTKSNVLYNQYYHTTMIDGLDVQTGNMSSSTTGLEWLSVRPSFLFQDGTMSLAKEILFYKDSIRVTFYNRDDLILDYNISEEEFFMRSTVETISIFDDYTNMKYFKELRDVFFAGDPR